MIWTFLYWILLTLAITAMAYALFWNRPGWRGRPKLRCKKCFYDLTETPGDLKTQPIQCSECGKKHHSKRSMRKTKRSWRLVVVALVLLTGSNVFKSMPAIQQRGWVAGIPDWVLVLYFPFADTTPGSSFDQTMWGNSANPGIGKKLMQEMRSPAWNKPRSWLADRLVFLLARLEPEHIITDSTTDLGTLYASRINSALISDRAYGFEERWARSIAYAEFHTNERWAPGATVYGKLKIRRLVHGQYRVDVGQNVAWFESRTKSDSVHIGGFFWGGPVIQSMNEYIERQQWDGLNRIPRVLYGESSVGEMAISRSQIDPTAQGKQQKRVPIAIYDKLKRSNLGDVDWSESTQFNVEYSYIVDRSAGPQVIEDPAYISELQSKLYAELGVRFDREERTWELVASVRQREISWDTSMTFGGKVTIELEGANGYRQILRGPKKWWRWVPETQPPESMSSDDPGYWGHFRNGYLVPAGAEANDASDAWGMPFYEDGSSVRFKNEDGILVLRIKTEQSGFGPIVYADLSSKRVLMGDLVIPIRRWTVEELNQFRVNGIVPDHAMP